MKILFSPTQQTKHNTLENFAKFHLLWISSGEWSHDVCSTNIEWMQCVQIGRYLKVLGDKFSYKSNPNVCWLFGQFWIRSHSPKSWCGDFLASLGKFGLPFIIPFVHTGRYDHACLFRFIFSLKKKANNFSFTNFCCRRHSDIFVSPLYE